MQAATGDTQKSGKTSTHSVWGSWNRLRIRTLLILLSLLVIETLLLFSLRHRGWTATTASASWTLSLLAAGLPLVIAVLLIGWRGFKYRLRTFLLCTSLVCIFFGISIRPLVRERQIRRGASALRLAGVELRAFASGDYDFDHPEKFDARKKFSTTTDIPAWLLPLAGDLPTIPQDKQIKGVVLTNDDQIDVLLANADQLNRIRSLELFGRVTDGGIKRLVASASKFPNINTLSIALTATTPDAIRSLTTFGGLKFLLTNGVQLPKDNWISEFKELESLNVWDERFAIRLDVPGAPIWTNENMKDVYELDNLKQATFRGLDLSNVDLTGFLETPDLRILRIDCTGTDPQQIELLKQRLPYVLWND